MTDWLIAARNFPVTGFGQNGQRTRYFKMPRGFGLPGFLARTSVGYFCDILFIRVNSMGAFFFGVIFILTLNESTWRFFFGSLVEIRDRGFGFFNLG